MPAQGVIFSIVLSVPIVLTAVLTIIITSRLDTHGRGGSSKRRRL